MITTHGISEEEGDCTLLTGFNLPGPMPYAFQMRILSFPYSMLFRKLMPSIFNGGNFDGVKGSHRETATTGTPPDDRITSFISTGVSTSFPEFG